MKLRPDEIVPRKNEIFFLLKLIVIITAGLIVSALILFVFLNRNLGSSYPSAIQIISDVFNKMSLVIVIAVIAQFSLSTLLLFLVALLFSHKIAGPMFRLKKILKQFRDSEDLNDISFRRTDFLPGVSRWFSGFFSMLNKQNRLLAEAESLLPNIEAELDGEKRTAIERIKGIVAELGNEDVP
ncbi:MAG: hypothetical protein JXB23_08510 [Candidatus Aminicenantes bacterium]|nr:hypothetical protein [Candidatus Aminicenantes bacterium]